MTYTTYVTSMKHMHDAGPLHPTPPLPPTSPHGMPPPPLRAPGLYQGVCGFVGLVLLCLPVGLCTPRQGPQAPLVCPAIFLFGLVHCAPPRGWPCPFSSTSSYFFLVLHVFGVAVVVVAVLGAPAVAAAVVVAAAAVAAAVVVVVVVVAVVVVVGSRWVCRRGRWSDFGTDMC